MNNFDLKQWLFENKLGSYEKASRLREFNVDDAFGDGSVNRGDMSEITQDEADVEMQKQDDQRGGMVMAEAESQSTDAKIQEWPVYILGKNYLVDANVDVDFHYDADDNGFVIDGATAVITRLGVVEGDEIRDITDPAAIKLVQDQINNDPRLNKALQEEADESINWWKMGGPEERDDYEPEGFGETVGYAMITKPSDPAERGD